MAFSFAAVNGRRAFQRPGNTCSFMLRRWAVLASNPSTTSARPKTMTERKLTECSRPERASAMPSIRVTVFHTSAVDACRYIRLAEEPCHQIRSLSRHCSVGVTTAKQSTTWATGIAPRIASMVPRS